jgi:hypothetical protein
MKKRNGDVGNSKENGNIYKRYVQILMGVFGAIFRPVFARIIHQLFLSAVLWHQLERPQAQPQPSAWPA